MGRCARAAPRALEARRARPARSPLPRAPQAFKVIEWARNNSASPDPLFARIDYAAGAGVVGHSLGGQAAAMAATRGCPARWGIKTAVLHHPANGALPFGNIGANMTVPVAAFTSSGDAAAPESQAYMAAFNATGLPRALRYEVGWSHLEPVLWPPCENPLLATFTAAWLKVFLGGDIPRRVFRPHFWRRAGLALQACADDRVQRCGRAQFVM